MMLAGSGDLLFTVVPMFIGIIFVIIFIGIIASLFTGLRQWKKNEESPRLSIEAIVKSKRTNVTGNIHPNHHHNIHSHSSTTIYFVPLKRVVTDSEFHVSGKEYGILAEGNIGTLTFQGTRYLDFIRKKLD